MGCHPPRPLARPRCPGFNSHSALFSHRPSARSPVRSTLPSVLATMRRRRRDDDKRGARIIELPCPALPLPRHRCLFRSRATREFLPLLPKTFRRQTGSSPLRSAQRSLHLFPSLAKKDASRLESNLVLVRIRIWAGRAPRS